MLKARECSMTNDIPDGNWLESSAGLETATNSFIVVIRSQAGPADDQPPGWHGSVEHAQSRERIYFIDYPRLTAFIAARCQTPLVPPWRTRLARRWQKSALHNWLNPLKYPPPVNPPAHSR
jgi:hypothetical protein